MTGSFDILISDFDEDFFKVDFPGRFNEEMLNAVRDPESAVSLEETLEDAYTALLMREAIGKGTEVRSRKMPWAPER